MSTKELGVVEENGVRRDGTEEGVEQLVALGRALSDPIRVRMLSMMADGRSCCDFSDSGVPVEEGRRASASASSRSTSAWAKEGPLPHEEAQGRGLVREERRGKGLYSLDRDVAGALLGEAADRLLSGAEKRSVVGECC